MTGYREQASHDWTEDSVRLIATPSAFAKAALYYVQEAGQFRTMPSYYTERENLDSYLILYTTGGTGYLTYGNKTYTITPNQLVYIDCRKYQYYRTDSSDLWEMLWIHFNGSSAPAYYDRFASTGSPVITLPGESRIPELLREIVGLHQHKTIQTELSGSRVIVDLLTEVLLTGQYLPESSDPGIPATIRNVMNHYDRHYSARLSLDEIAALFSIDKYHLSKEFKRYTGFSPNDYLINTRITRAKELIRFTDMPIAEIASAVGIDNVSHFINLFRSREALTPLVYRKHWQPSPS
ncbi:AraC family transcriptional regulator [Cohnella cholangitidis]|uniref:Helix-turn-helix domain-containing protein n=1 Tax=Cohnella cholangitidis TaxID=2598458 RepID=A0A7G5C0I0_9BACL|nr:AraC family transcriptional regulator [Cohnella cholangitidis]QMV42714.1 helix-turn-helix domain-containing protein [Cohnella cholangitidis]